MRRHKSTKPFVGVVLKHIIGILYEKHSDSLRAGRSGDRILVVGEIFRTCPDAASYAVGTGSLPGVKRTGRDVDHTPLSSAEFKERVELYIY